MPQITVDGPRLPDMDRRRILVKKLTEAVSEAYAISPEHITVVIQEHDSANVAVGGELLADRGAKGGSRPQNP